MAPTKLRSVLEEAKRHLAERVELQEKAPAPAPKGEAVPAKSKLNTMLGRMSIPVKPSSVFQPVGVVQRPTYDLIADRVLGKDVGEPRSFLDTTSSYADHVAQRLRHLNEQLNLNPKPTLAAETDHPYVGVEPDGRPVWSQVLDEHRGRVSHQLNDELAPPSLGEAHHHGEILDLSSAWPSRLSWSTQTTFKQWFVAEENLESTQLCEATVDAPARLINPLFIESHPQSGCSHLLHATGQAMLRRGEGHVLMITASDALTVDITDHMWRHAMTGAIALIVDDVQEFAADPDWNHQLGVLLDQALNLGLQVVAGGRGPLADYAPSRLKEVLSTSPSVRLRPPNASTLLAYGRWRCGQKNLLVSDGHLAQLARMRPTGWRPFENRLTEVALAMERGSVLLDHDDVADLLSSSSRSQPPIEQQLPVEDLATQLVGEVLDSVYSSVDAGGVDLHAPLSSLSEDDYEPPEWDSATFAANRPDGFEERLKATIESVSPSHPSVLEVHERERHLLNAHHRLEGKDVERAVDILVDLDESIDRRMGRSDAASIQETTELNRLEEQMVVLAQRAVDADIDELITIADDLRELEERLVAIDPDREPLPPFEDDAPSERRHVGRRRSKPASSPQESLDEYEPEGEWDIDGTGIEASDLLEDEPTPTPHVVHLARLHKRHVLAGEEE